MFGPEGFGGIRGNAGTITAAGGALVAQIARWSVRRVGSTSDRRPILQFRAHFSWRSDVLLAMCGRGEMKARVRVYKKGREGEKDEQIDIVSWDSWRMDEDGVLILDNVLHFDTAPIR